MRCKPNTQNSPCGYIPDGSGAESTVGTYKKGKKCKKCTKNCNPNDNMCCTCIAFTAHLIVGSILGYLIVFAIGAG